MAVVFRFQSTVFQIAIKPRLIDRHDWPQPHGYRGKLPEVRHQPWVGIRGQAGMLAQFPAEILQVFFAKTAFQIGAGVYARGSMALEIDQIATVVFPSTTEEV